MKRTPLCTLLGGLAVGAGLLAMNVNTAGGDDASPALFTTPATSAAAAPSGPPPSSSPAEAPVSAVWAGHVKSSGTLAISVQDGVAVAYLCDGRAVEAWLQGTAAGGKLDLTGRNGATLTGTFGGGKATGRITVAKTTVPFTVRTVKAPSGLYRATATVRGAQVEGGWIVLDDGTQVGLVTVDGATRAAPPLDTATGTVAVNGAEIIPIRPRELS